MKFLKLDFLANHDLALLALRLWLGLSMLLLHGWGKLMGFAKIAPQFPDPLGVGTNASLTLAIVGEVAGSVLLVLGFFTRLGALLLVITMAIAFLGVHGGALHDDPATGAHSGELAFVYLAGYVTLLFAGAGRFSLDRR